MGQQRRVELNNLLGDILEEKFDVRNVYFNPPEDVKLQFPCFVYFRSSSHRILRANNTSYKFTQGYKVTFIGRRPDDSFIEEMTSRRYVGYNTSFMADGLVHDEYTIYF